MSRRLSIGSKNLFMLMDIDRSLSNSLSIMLWSLFILYLRAFNTANWFLTLTQVIDELGSLCSSGYLDAVKSIKQAISSKHQSIIFNDSFSATIIPAVQSLLGRSINRVTVSDSVASQGSCIIQTVNVCASEEKKLQKVRHMIHYFYLQKHRFKVLWMWEYKKAKLLDFGH